MIEFYGELSDKCKIERAKKISKNNGIMFTIVTIIISIITLFFGIINDTWYYALILIVLFIIITVFAFIVPKKRILGFKVSINIIIEKNTISITTIGDKKRMKTMSLTKIKEVVDSDEWYEIIFKFGNISNSWVCQKDLLVSGTLEEFEKLFEGKIKRKINKNCNV